MFSKDVLFFLIFFHTKCEGIDFSIPKTKELILPNLPVGEIYTVFNTFSACESTKDHQIKFNIYPSKKSLNVTELKGNTTLSKDFDDSTILELNLASWSLRGGWIDNYVDHKFTSGCSTFKRIAGEAWNSYLKAFKIARRDCPVVKGTYVSSGLNLNELRNNNFPKTFFYGKFKGTMKIKSKEFKLLGCITTEMEFVRPWEIPRT